MKLFGFFRRPSFNLDDGDVRLCEAKTGMSTLCARSALPGRKFAATTTL